MTLQGEDDGLAMLYEFGSIIDETCFIKLGLDCFD